jgi:CDP-glucose 4,6-dehydratase
MNEDPVRFSTPFNFGPDVNDTLTVEDLTKIFLQRFGRGDYKIVPAEKPLHEANLLMLDSSKAWNLIGWKPHLNATHAIEITADWYADKENTAHEKCMRQIQEYFAD